MRKVAALNRWIHDKRIPLPAERRPGILLIKYHHVCLVEAIAALMEGILI